ncbi:transglutaminase TgpA family protein [Aromatoleum sp.]|uniref:transglutaminase TgpA family protein n=1 Tax=Aromatoleum sp. TaxID=2307007 RepID=UPI002FC8587B
MVRWFPLDHQSARWLLATAAATLAPHAIHLPPWLLAICALLLAWRSQLPWQKGAAGHRVAILFLALGTAVGVRLHFGHFFGRDSGVALLAALLCLKVLESSSARDVRACVLLSFFLQLGLFFYDQTPAIGALALVGSLLAIVTLTSLQDAAAPLAAQLRTGALLLAQGLPFMIALFVLFPRVQGPLWGLPADAYAGRSGLSDSMTPGSISQLGLSDAIAFRAAFRAAPPPRAQRYWRGPVLTTFDGQTWRPGSYTVASQPSYRAAGPTYRYRLTLEPHGQNWLLALDYPAGVVRGARYASDHRLLADAPLRGRSRFDLVATPSALIGLDENSAVLAAARHLPPESNPRARALARKFAESDASPAVILERTLAHLRASRLTYTLNPPRLGKHSVDGFLFDTRRGFCEHFSSAFVFLIRAAGVPSRVVTGYQGGEINPIDGSLVVRQSDAHAWAEVWLAGRGWVRVDPTALAAPLRIEAGLGAALPEGEPLPFMRRTQFAWLLAVRNQWEAASHTWNQWVLGYNPDRQRELLARLGFPGTDWQALTVLLGATGAGLMLLLFAGAFLQRNTADRLDRAWSAFCRKLAKRGVARQPWEGPVDYGVRAANAFPRQAAALHAIAANYARLRYGPLAEPGAVLELYRRIRRLKLQ